MTNDALPLESLATRARRFAFPVPDALLALIYAVAAFWEGVPEGVVEALVFGLIVEGGFLFMQCTLVDVATRLKKRPPWWLIPIIVGAILLFTGGSAHEVLQMAWNQGMVVFLPLVVSVLERGYLLWQMPVRTRVQKIAARALVGNRMITGIALTALMLILSFVLDDTGRWLVLGTGALYFAIAAWDDYRVRLPRFAEKPRVLFGYDVLQIEYLDPL